MSFRIPQGLLKLAFKQNMEAIDDLKYIDGIGFRDVSLIKGQNKSYIQRNTISSYVETLGMDWAVAKTLIPGVEFIDD